MVYTWWKSPESSCCLIDSRWDVQLKMLWLWIDEKINHIDFWRYSRIHDSPHSLGRFRKYFSRCRTSLTIATIMKVPRSSRCNVTTGIWKWVICPQYVPNKMGQNLKMGQSYINFEKNDDKLYDRDLRSMMSSIMRHHWCVAVLFADQLAAFCMVQGSHQRVWGK